MEIGVISFSLRRVRVLTAVCRYGALMRTRCLEDRHPRRDTTRPGTNRTTTGVWGFIPKPIAELGFSVGTRGTARLIVVQALQTHIC